MTRLLLPFALALLAGLAPAAHAQCAAGTIDGAFVETSAGPYAPGDTFEATLFLSRQGGASDMGTSTMVLDYNDAAMTYAAEPAEGTDYEWLRYYGGAFNPRPTVDGNLSAYRGEVRVTNASRLVPFIDLLDTSSPDDRGEELPGTPTAVLTLRWTVVDATEGIVVSPRSQQFFDGPGGPTGCYEDGTFAGLEVGQQTTSGGAGWRMLAAPAGGLSPNTLAGLNYLQGFPSHVPELPTNLYAGYDGTDYGVPPAEDAEIAPGTGLLWYMYEASTFPNGAPPASFNALPVTLTHGGPAVASLVEGGELGTDAYAIPLHTDGDGYNLVGNPFATDLDVTQIAPTGGAFVSAVVQSWDPSAGAGDGSTGPGSYVLSSNRGDRVSGWQGFFLENGSATAATVPVAARATGAALAGWTAEGDAEARGAAPARIAFTLDGALADGTRLLDHALALELSDAASPEWDRRDATKLAPFTAAYAALAFEGVRDGQPVLKAQEARPVGDAGFTVPLTLDLAGGDATLELRWDLLNMDPDVTLLLRDRLTGTDVDLRAATSYSFSAEATTARRAASLPGTALRSGAAARFALSVGQPPPVAAEGDAAVDALALDAPAPNPSRDRSRVVFALPEAGTVRVAVYDVLGREVAVLADGEHPAGRHQATLEARALAAGIYVIHLTAGDAALTRRVTVIR